MRKSILLLVIFFLLGICPLHSVHAQTIDPTQSVTGNIGITGRIFVDPQLIKLKIEAVDPLKENNIINQEDTITYRITIDNQNSRPTDLYLEASWPKAQFINILRPSIDLVDYVYGSATTGYNIAQPIIDTLNSKIRWNISQFPAVTSGQTIQFKLRTKDIYIDNKEIVRFPVNLYAVGPDEVTPGQISPAEEVLWYKYRAGDAPPGSAPTPASQTQIPLPTPSALSPLRITDFSVNTITSTSMQFKILKSTTSPLQINYGTSPNKLNNQIIDPINSREHLITITDLNPKTPYYFQFFIPNSKQPINKEIFTLTTASRDNFEEINNPFFTVLSHKGTILHIDTLTKDKKNKKIVSIWRNGILDITVSVPLALKDIRNITAYIRDQYVLAATTDNHDDMQTQSAELTLLEYPLYSGRLKFPDNLSDYEIILRTADIYGNISENIIGKVKTVEPFIIKDKISQKPIADAKVIVSRLNTNTNLYEEISIQAPFPNPQYSDKFGVVPIRMVEGKYQAQIEVSGFEQSSIYFEINENGINLPAVYLSQKSLIPKQITERPQVTVIIISLLLATTLILLYKKLHKKKSQNIKKLRWQS